MGFPSGTSQKYRTSLRSHCVSWLLAWTYSCNLRWICCSELALDNRQFCHGLPDLCMRPACLRCCFHTWVPGLMPRLTSAVQEPLDWTLTLGSIWLLSPSPVCLPQGSCFVTCTACMHACAHADVQMAATSPVLYVPTFCIHTVS